MRCYNGCIPESDYKARYGYTQRQWADAKQKHPHVLVTYFPVEGMYCACVPDQSYRPLGDFESDKMTCLLKAVEILAANPEP